jgi:hypothetical protein
VRVVQAIAKYNGVQCSLRVEDFEEAERAVGEESRQGWNLLSEGSAWKMQHVRALFATPKMAWSTSLLISIWGASSKSEHRVFLTLGRSHRARIDSVQQLLTVLVRIA